VLVLTVGHSVFRTLAETAAREGIDVNSLGLSLLMLGLGRQTAYVAARRNQAIADDAPNTELGIVCLACGRMRTDSRHRRCPTCGGSWTTAIR
jgi:hypothetical protein